MMLYGRSISVSGGFGKLDDWIEFLLLQIFLDESFFFD